MRMIARQGCRKIVSPDENGDRFGWAFELVLVAISVALVTALSIFAFKNFSKQETLKEEHGFGKVLENKYYVDEAYDAAVVEPIRKVSDKFLWRIFDVKII